MSFTGLRKPLSRIWGITINGSTLSAFSVELTMAERSSAVLMPPSVVRNMTPKRDGKSELLNLLNPVRIARNSRTCTTAMPLRTANFERT
jgi:hypothetical protein